MVVLVLILLIPINIFAQSPFYIAFKPGIYSPQSSDLDGLILVQWRFCVWFPVESKYCSGVGNWVFQHGRRKNGNRSNLWGSEKFRSRCLVFYFYLKGHSAYKKWEFFGFGGGGAYSVSRPYDVENYYHHYYYDDYDDDYDLVLGGYLGAGIHYNIAPKIFLGVEGKYLWTGASKIRIS